MTKENVSMGSLRILPAWRVATVAPSNGHFAMPGSEHEKLQVTESGSTLPRSLVRLVPHSTLYYSSRTV